MDLLVDRPIVLTGDMHCTSLAFEPGGSIDTNGYRLFVATLPIRFHGPPRRKKKLKRTRIYYFNSLGP